MDVNVALENIRTLAAAFELEPSETGIALELAAQVAALDEWISGGGFLPSDWSHEAPATGRHAA